MLNKRLVIVIIAAILTVCLIVGAVLLSRREKSDTPVPPSVSTDNSEDSSVTIPDIEVPSENIKVEDETKPGVSCTPFVDIVEGYEIYYDTDVTDKLSLLHEEGEEDLVNNMLDWITGYINHFASKGYSYTAICQIQRLFFITSDEMMTLDFEAACMNIARCIPASGAIKKGFENKVLEAFKWTKSYDYSYVFETEATQ